MVLLYIFWSLIFQANKIGAALSHKAEVDHTLTKLFFENKRGNYFEISSVAEYSCILCFVYMITTKNHLSMTRTMFNNFTQNTIHSL